MEKIESKLRDARENLRRMFPKGHDLVYENSDALVFAFSPKGKTSEAFVSVAGYPTWVTLFFGNGVHQKDADGLLEGKCKAVRTIRLGSPGDLEQREVKALIEQASAVYSADFADAPPRSTEIGSVPEKQRPGRL